MSKLLAARVIDLLQADRTAIGQWRKFEKQWQQTIAAGNIVFEQDSNVVWCENCGYSMENEGDGFYLCSHCGDEYQEGYINEEFQ